MPKIAKRKPPDAMIAFRLPKATLDRLQAMAASQDRTQSAQALRAIQIYLDHPDECEALKRQDKPPFSLASPAERQGRESRSPQSEL
jgi:hypothetical protein